MPRVLDPDPPPRSRRRGHLALPPCGRRTYGTDDLHDEDLSSYAETDQDDYEAAHAGCIQPHYTADGYVDCDGRPL